jgi:hypothetical protein
MERPEEEGDEELARRLMEEEERLAKSTSLSTSTSFTGSPSPSLGVKSSVGGKKAGKGRVGKGGGNGSAKITSFFGK